MGYLLWGYIGNCEFWFEDKDVTAIEIKANVTKIHCNNKSYILKEKGSIKQLLVEIHVLEQLEEKGVKVQKLVKTSNSKKYVFYKEKYYCLYEYIAGSVLEIKDTENLKELGSTIGEGIANLHQALNSVNNNELVKEICIHWYTNGRYLIYKRMSMLIRM